MLGLSDCTTEASESPSASRTPPVAGRTPRLPTLNHCATELSPPDGFPRLVGHASELSDAIILLIPQQRGEKRAGPTVSVLPVVPGLAGRAKNGVCLDTTETTLETAPSWTRVRGMEPSILLNIPLQYRVRRFCRTERAFCRNRGCAGCDKNSRPIASGRCVSRHAFASGRGRRNRCHILLRFRDLRRS
jgi:hypothetical protein